MKTRFTLIAALGALMVSGPALAWGWGCGGYGGCGGCGGYGAAAADPAWVEQRFSMIDTNNDGFISREEAQASAPRLSVMFDTVDTNKDGQISLDEMKAFHAQMAAAGQNARTVNMQARFQAADANGDGFLSREEAAVLPFVSANFDLIDTNKDGQISLDEFVAFRTQMRGGRGGMMRGQGYGGGGYGRGYGAGRMGPGGMGGW